MQDSSAKYKQMVAIAGMTDSGDSAIKCVEIEAHKGDHLSTALLELDADGWEDENGFDVQIDKVGELTGVEARTHRISLSICVDLLPNAETSAVQEIALEIQNFIKNGGIEKCSDATMIGCYVTAEDHVDALSLQDALQANRRTKLRPS